MGNEMRDYCNLDIKAGVIGVDIERVFQTRRQSHNDSAFCLDAYYDHE
jgi:hypothetical protein